MQSNSTDTSKDLPLLIYANPEHVSDLLYVTGLMAPDPYFALKTENELVIAVSPLEYGRAVKDSNATEIIDISTLSGAAEPYLSKGYSSESSNIILVLKKKGIQEVVVTKDFPYYIALDLHKEDISVSIYPEPALKARIIKTDEEVDKIRDAIRITEKCHARVEQILRESVIEDGKLKWEGEFLTSEKAQQEISIVCAANDCIDGDPIVACGDQGCDPHEKGHGVLYANELIIVDIFPRSKKHHYWGDITRTFIKGKASDEQRKLVETVAKAQKMGISRIADGAVTGEIHKEIDDFFVSEGYVTEIVDGVYQGFFHGTGHGFGLDIHEQPRIGKNQVVELKAGMIVTVEPGLYYPGIGGCRIEDDILVTKDGCEVLSDYPYNWEIE